MKKLLVLSALSLALLACDDSSSSTDPSVLYGEWTSDATFPGIAGTIAVSLDLSLNEDKTMELDFEAGSTLGTGTATGTWALDGNTLTITPESCPTDQLACTLAFGNEMVFTVSNLEADSWSAEYHMSGASPITMEFERIAD